MPCTPSSRTSGSASALDEPIVRLHKLGRKLYVEVDFVVEPGEWDVSEEDAVRRAVAEGLVPLGLDVWAYVELTTDRALVDGSGRRTPWPGQGRPV